MRLCYLLAFCAAPVMAQDLQLSGTLTALSYGDVRGLAPETELTGQFGIAGQWDIGADLALDIDFDAYLSNQRDETFIDPAFSIRSTSHLDW